MAIRSDREDTTRQQENLEAARLELQRSLEDLTDEAKKAAKACGSKRANPDIEAVQAAWLAVDRAREAVELAVTDLAGARGEDL